MYLTACMLRNAGPLRELDLSLPFDQHGRPVPVCFVGCNGSGKTILLSYITDALFEFAKTTFRNVLPQEGMSRAFFRVISDTNRTVGTPYSLSVMQFSHDGVVLQYTEKTGAPDVAALQSAMEARFGRPVSLPGGTEGAKQEQADQPAVEAAFSSNALCFFPAGRVEQPSWVNPEASVDAPPSLTDMVRHILRKPIVVDRSGEENRRWLLDLFLDSAIVDYDASEHPAVSISQDVRQSWGQRQVLLAINKVIQTILQDSAARLVMRHRATGISRFGIMSGNEWKVPTLSHLSAGQGILFNMFVTIIRYADATVAATGRLDEIAGIVAVDEVDAHLHIDLQIGALPELIALLPQVQFILTSHSPFFLLGMHKRYGADGTVILELPKGRRLVPEEFREFEKAFDVFRQTRAFDNELERHMAARQKPLVLVEGQTDPMYLKKWLELMGHQDLLDGIEIDWIGATEAGGKALNTGKDAINHARRFLRANPRSMTRRIMLLGDCDTNLQAETHEGLNVRAIPRNEANEKVRSGIENLLPAELFTEEWYETHEHSLGDGGVDKKTRLRKMDFARYVCEQRGKSADFTAFEVLAPVLRELLT